MAQYLKLDVQQRLLTAARARFAASGFQGASIRDVASDANVALGNLYNYFGDKKALFEQSVEPAYSELNAALAALPAGPGDPAAQAAVIAEFLDTHRESLLLLVRSAGGSHLDQYTREVAGKLSAYLGDHPLAGAVGHLWVGAAGEALIAGLDREALEVRAREVLAFTARGDAALDPARRFGSPPR